MKGVNNEATVQIKASTHWKEEKEFQKIFIVEAKI